MSAWELILDTPNVLHNQHIHPLGMLGLMGIYFISLSPFVAVLKEDSLLLFCKPVILQMEPYQWNTLLEMCFFLVSFKAILYPLLIYVN